MNQELTPEKRQKMEVDSGGSNQNMHLDQIHKHQSILKNCSLAHSSGFIDSESESTSSSLPVVKLSSKSTSVNSTPSFGSNIMSSPKMLAFNNFADFMPDSPNILRDFSISKNTSTGNHCNDVFSLRFQPKSTSACRRLILDDKPKDDNSPETNKQIKTPIHLDFPVKTHKTSKKLSLEQSNLSSSTSSTSLTSSPEASPNMPEIKTQLLPMKSGNVDLNSTVSSSSPTASSNSSTSQYHSKKKQAKLYNKTSKHPLVPLFSPIANNLNKNETNNLNSSTIKKTQHKINTNKNSSSVSSPVTQKTNSPENSDNLTSSFQDSSFHNSSFHDSSFHDLKPLNPNSFSYSPSLNSRSFTRYTGIHPNKLNKLKQVQFPQAYHSKNNTSENNDFCNFLARIPRDITQQIITQIPGKHLREAASCSKQMFYLINSFEIARERISKYIFEIPERQEDMHLDHFGVFRSPMRPKFYQTRQKSQQQQQQQHYNSPRLRSPIINRSPVGNRSPVANRMPVAPKPAIKLSPRSDHRKSISLTLQSDEKCTPCPRCMFTAKFNQSTNEAKCSRCEHHYCVVCSHDYSKDFNVQIWGYSLKLLNFKKTKILEQIIG